MNVSFDFDGTLTKKSVQDFVNFCNNQRINVYIVTSRHKEGVSATYNDDLYKIAYDCGIPQCNIVFTSGSPKKNYFKQFPDFIFHLDDDWIELHEIEQHTDIKAIPVFGNSDWEQQCWNEINSYRNGKG